MRLTLDIGILYFSNWKLGNLRFIILKLFLSIRATISPFVTFKEIMTFINKLVSKPTVAFERQKIAFER